MLDEFHEDIAFLAFAILRNEVTPLHKEYLEAFYKEEFDSATLEATLDRPMVRRQKIRAHLARLEQQPSDPSTFVTMYKTIHNGYSGYVHGAFPHIMDLVLGDPPTFHIHGMSGTPREQYHRYDLYNPFFRAIIAFAIAAKALGDEKLAQDLTAYHLEFDKLSGRNESHQNSSSAEPKRSSGNS